MATLQHPPAVETHRLEPSGAFPNNPHLPLVLYRAAIAEPDPSSAEAILRKTGWTGAWRNGVFDFHHFHSNAHEVLLCCAGEADVCFGGPGGPVVHIMAGDAAVLPAGTGHKNERSSDDFLIVGAYPPEQGDYDMHRGDESELDDVRHRIAAVPIPETDPLYGSDGPLLKAWEK